MVDTFEIKNVYVCFDEREECFCVKWSEYHNGKCSWHTHCLYSENSTVAVEDAVFYFGGRVRKEDIRQYD